MDGKLVIIPDIDRLKAIGGGINTRQNGPIATGLRTLCVDSPHLLVKPHTGWGVKGMAKWLTRGPLPMAGAAAHQWVDDDAMFGAEDLVRCAIQGFSLRFEGDRAQDVEALNGPSAERNPESTQRELDKEIVNGNIIGPWAKPPLRGFRVTPRGTKPEATKDRPTTMVHDGQSAHWQIGQRWHP